MRSADVLDRPTSVPGSPRVRDLLVLWQHPESRQIVPIGRFGFDGSEYTFSYTRAAGTVQDFRPLPGLDDMHQQYRSDRLPVAFGARVMEPDRADYADYLHYLDLDPTTSTPWEQIVRSGGSRAGDTLQFMEVPSVINGRAHARFLVNGIRHIPNVSRRIDDRHVTVTVDEHGQAIQSLQVGDEVAVEAEYENSYDDCASVLTSNGTPLGWVPRAMSAGVRALLDHGSVSARVLRVGSPNTPPHLRLVMELDMDAPEGFQFDREGLWEPIRR